MSTPTNRAPMLAKNRKRSRRAFTSFTECDCCAGPTEKGRAAEKNDWKKETHDELHEPRS